MVLFARHNLVKDPPFSHIDLVSCRNLLIYLNRAAQQRVLEVLHFALNPGGFLFLGTSESVEGAGDLFVPVIKDAHIYESRGGAARVVPIPVLTVSDTGSPRRRLDSQASTGDARDRQAPADLHQRLLELYAPPSILVNDEHEIVHMSERVGRFLHFAGGEPSHNLLKVIRPELRLELRTALYQAAQHRTNFEARGLRVRLDPNRSVVVNLLVRPMVRADDPARGFFLVLFEEAQERAEAAEELRVSTEPARQLEEELVRLKAQLRTTVEQYETQAEELRASNEELQAINEELRSATEELETSKEELQSLNEELRTVNQELKIKIDEQTQTSNDVQNLVNSTDFGTVFLDRGGRIKLFTPRARDIFSLIPSDRGRPLEDINCSLLDVDLQGDIERVLERLERVEREVVTREGRWHLMRLAPYRTAEDRIDGVVLSFLDITDRKHATERVRQSEERLRRALEVDTVGVLFLRVDGTITDANDAFLRMSGIAREDVRHGRLHWEGLAAPEWHPRVREALEMLGTSGRAAPFELECRRPDNERWWAIFAGTRLGEAEGVMFVVDITDRQRAAEALRRADRRKNEFLATLAHELRNPLAPIATALEVLRLSGAASEPQGERARAVMERQVRHMVRLIDDLLEVSRITLGKIELRRASADLAALVRSALEDSGPAIRAMRHDLTVEITTEPLPVHADAVRLVQVFTNLLNNGAKYTPEGGSLAVIVRRVEGEAEVVIRDSGVGIAPDVLPHVFDLFAQGAEMPPGRSQSGLGIGLTLVRTLIEAHGGRVSVESEGVHRGTTVVVRLPLSTAAVEPAIPEPVPEVQLQGRHLLVVDDNHDAADSLKTLLELMGADVEVTYDGTSALASVAANPPSLVFLDIGLPDLDGFTVAREIRQQPGGSDIVLVALTGWSQPQHREASLAAGFDHHLTKPATTARLRQLLGNVASAGDGQPTNPEDASGD